MSETIYNKLVRDKIPDIIIKSGKVPKFKCLNYNEYFKYLNEKLLEECHEVLRANSKVEILEELADTLEVIKSLTLCLNSNMYELESIRKEKFESRGGFSSRIFLEKVVDNN